MKAFETKAIVDAGSTVRLSGLPFAVGERVRILVLPDADPNSQGHNYGVDSEKQSIIERLRGSVLKDEDPFGPAAPLEDWEALR